jgi:CRP-like cAMP-binding protein
MTIIERVLLLQGVDLLSNVTSEQLSYIAMIGEEMDVETETILFREGDPPNGLYVVISGGIAVTRGKNLIQRIGPNGSFGVWGLFDDQPQLATAAASESSRLFFVPRAEFYEVLSNHVDIVQGIFKKLVQRLRRLATLAEN